jgi:hypothetical protein
MFKSLQTKSFQFLLESPLEPNKTIGSFENQIETWIGGCYLILHKFRFFK